MVDFDVYVFPNLTPHKLMHAHTHTHTHTHTHSQDLIMAHAVKRVMFCTADTKKHLFVLVAKNPETGPEGVYSHVFLTAKKEQVSI